MANSPKNSIGKRTFYLTTFYLTLLIMRDTATSVAEDGVAIAGQAAHPSAEGG